MGTVIKALRVHKKTKHIEIIYENIVLSTQNYQAAY